jgi:hypothetical protein
MVNDRHAQICMRSWFDVFEQFNFPTGAVDRYVPGSGRFASCWAREAGREMQKEHSAVREPDVSS